MKTQDKANQSQISDQIKTLSASALALASRGEIADAEEVYKRILDIAPYHASSRSFMASQAFARGNADESLMHLDKAIQGNPKSPVLLQNRALVYKRLNRFDAAIDDLDAALALQPDLHSARLYKAFVLKEAGDWNSAIRLVTSVMKEIPDLRSWAVGGSPAEQLPALAVEASNVIRAAQLSLIDAELQPVINKFSKEALRRIFEGVAAYAGLREKDPDAPPQPARGLSIQGLDESTGFNAPVDKWPAGTACDMQVVRDEVLALLEQRNPAYFTGSKDPASEAKNAPLQKYTMNLTTGQLSAAPALARLMRAAQSGHVAADPEGMTLTLAPPGKHILQRATAENWRLTGHTLFDGADVVAASIGGHAARLSRGDCLLASNLVDHVFEAEGERGFVLLSLQVWHPGLSDAETEGLTAVMRAFERFRAKYT